MMGVICVWLAHSMKTHGAAFFDVDGTLVATTVVHPCLWYAAHQALPRLSLAKSVGLLLRTPLYWALDQVSRAAFNTCFYREYRGMTRNRLVTLAVEMFATMIQPRLYPGAVDLVDRAREQGLLPVLVTGALDFTVAPLAAHLGIDHVVANRLVFEHGVATGDLVPPLIAEASKATAIRRFANAHRIDLEHSFAYADSYSDLPMLSSVGHPAAVQPDWRLSRAAATNRWPVITWN